MTTYTYPAVTPNSSSIEYIANTEKFISPTTGAIQTVDRGGEHWRMTLTYNNLKTADRALLFALVGKLNGQQHRVDLPYHGLDNQGAFGGTPLVNGASQTGNTLTVDGCSSTVTNWIRAGDFFSVNDELKMATLDASSDGGGNITLTFTPRLRASPSDGAAIETSAPTGVFMLANNRQSWSMRPYSFSDITLVFLEDIAA